MSETLVIRIVQPKIFWESMEVNLGMYSEMLDDLPPCDLIIFPEMFTTGFTMNTSVFTDESNIKVMNWMDNLARENSSFVMGSIGYHHHNSFFNRLILTDISGHHQFYDKRHLFSPGKEHESFISGKNRVLFEINNWRIFPQICYDLRFPVWTRNDLNYDIIINVANWPSVRTDHWRTLLKARAIENQAYVIGVNRVGRDFNGIEYSGCSSAYNFGGQLLFELNEKPCFKDIRISRKEITEYRSSLNFLKDRDQFQIME